MGSFVLLKLHRSVPPSTCGLDEQLSCERWSLRAPASEQTHELKAQACHCAEVSATDSSDHWEAEASATVPAPFARELARHVLRKPVWARLLRSREELPIPTARPSTTTSCGAPSSAASLSERSGAEGSPNGDISTCRSLGLRALTSWACTCTSPVRTTQATTLPVIAECVLLLNLFPTT